MDKLEQQLTFLQQEVMGLKSRMNRLELRGESKDILVNLIDEQTRKLRKERNIMIKAEEDTKFNAGQLQMCVRLRNLVKDCHKTDKK